MIGIIGGGISGLAVAYYLHQQDTPYILLEAAPQVGGVIQSERDGDYWKEIGPNSLLCDENMKARLLSMGFVEKEMITANEVSKDRYIYRNGAYRKLPSSPPSLLLNTFFSWKTKWAIFQERNNKSKGPDNETLSDFFARRFSQEIVDYALDPFVAGIYAGDPKKLLIKYTFPQLLKYEKEYGSIIKGFIKNKGGARKVSISFKEGMQQLPFHLAKGLNIKLSAPVQAISILNDNDQYRYAIQTATNTWKVDQIVMATPANITAQLLQTIDAQYAEKLHQVRYAPMVAVHTVFDKKAVGFAPNGFGGLHPRKEGLFTAGHIWSSAVFDGKCPEDQVLFTSFVGGDQGAEKTKSPLQEIQQQAVAEIQKLYKISQAPLYQSSYRWDEAIPQYDEALHAVYEQQTRLASQKIHICSNYIGGVSIPDCIQKGESLAKRLKDG